MEKDLPQLRHYLNNPNINALNQNNLNILGINYEHHENDFEEQ